MKHQSKLSVNYFVEQIRKAEDNERLKLLKAIIKGTVEEDPDYLSESEKERLRQAFRDRSKGST